MKTTLAIAILASAMSKLPRTAVAHDLVSRPENLFAQDDSFAAQAAACDDWECLEEGYDYCLDEPALEDFDVCVKAGLYIWDKCAKDPC